MASALTLRKNASCLNASARWIRRLLQLSLPSPHPMPSSWLSVYLAAASVTERVQGSSQAARSRDCIIESALQPRNSAAYGTSVSVRVDLGGGAIIKKKKTQN